MSSEQPHITEYQGAAEALQERVKELNCLYGISSLLMLPDISFVELMHRIVLLLPPAWRFPEITEACITLAGQTFQTPRFQETPWMLVSEIIVNGQQAGVVKVCCLEERQASDAGSFLVEERHLLNTIAERLGHIIARSNAEEALLRSEERFRTAINATRDGLWEWDCQTNKEFFSPRWCEIIGYSPDDPELVHDFNSWATRIHPDDYDNVILALNQHLESGTIYDVEYRHRHKSGEYRWQSSRGQAIFDEKGMPIKMVGCISDITERKRAEEVLRLSHQDLEDKVRERTATLEKLNKELLAEIILHARSEKALLASEKKYSSLVENFIIGICIIQEEMIVFTNQRFVDIFECSPADCNGIAFSTLLHPDETKAIAGAVADAAEGNGGRLEKEVRAFTKDGRLIWIELRLGSIEFNDKPAVIFSVVDITRRKELEYLIRIQDKMTSLGRVAAGIAHELRNPLSGINIHLSNLERVFAELDDLPEETREIVQRILANLKTASTKIENVVKRVYDFSRPSMHKLVQVDVNRSIREMIKISAVTLRQKGIAVEKRLAPGSMVCSANQNLFEQLLMNLITNATQVLENQTSDKKILITSAAASDMVVIRIADSGPGVPDHLRHKIFDPFFTMKQDGLGVGLSICYRIVKDHGGSLSVGRSRELGGAEFTISLPVKIGG